MSKTKKAMPKGTKIKLAVKEALNFLNEGRSPENKVDIKTLAQMIGEESPQNLHNAESGKTPKVLLRAMNISLVTGYPVEKLIKEIK